jgi:hypothetical protein
VTDQNLGGRAGWLSGGVDQRLGLRPGQEHRRVRDPTAGEEPGNCNCPKSEN